MDGTPPILYKASFAPDRFEAQLSQHQRLLHFAVKRYVRARPDLKDDILAVGRAALAEALQTYRAGRGATLSTYACNLIGWRVSCFLRKFTSKDASTTSLDESLGEGEDGAFTLANVADHQAAVREQAAALADENLLNRLHDLRVAITTCATLTVGEREILKAFLESGNCGTVAASLGVTSTRVSQALASAASKLRKHLQLTLMNPGR
jgi:RNA polymerase sigma factor (sigma-70 family)